MANRLYFVVHFYYIFFILVMQADQKCIFFAGIQNFMQQKQQINILINESG